MSCFSHLPYVITYMDPHDHEDEQKHRHVDTHEVLWLVSRFLFMLYSTLPLPTLLKFDKKVTKMQKLAHDTSVYVTGWLGS